MLAVKKKHTKCVDKEEKGVYNKNHTDSVEFEREVMFMGYAEKLRKLRGGKSRADVCKDTGIKLSTLQMYECGERNPKDSVKRILADYYGKTVQEIFFDD